MCDWLAGLCESKASKRSVPLFVVAARATTGSSDSHHTTAANPFAAFARRERRISQTLLLKIVLGRNAASSHAPCAPSSDHEPCQWTYGRLLCSICRVDGIRFRICQNIFQKIRIHVFKPDDLLTSPSSSPFSTFKVFPM